jgi:hypothetical protein
MPTYADDARAATDAAAAVPNPSAITRLVRAAGYPRATSNVYRPGVVLTFLGDGATPGPALAALTAAGYRVDARGALNVFVR